MKYEKTANRTNLELKLLIYYSLNESFLSANRTNLELKLVFRSPLIRLFRSANRTNLELKLRHMRKSRYGMENCQSHQSGIETVGI